MSIFPETLIFSAEEDICNDSHIEFVEKMKKNNNKAELIIIPKTKHGFMSYGDNCSKFSTETIEILKQKINFLNKPVFYI